MELNDKIVIYRSEDGETQLEVRINQDTVVCVNRMGIRYFFVFLYMKNVYMVCGLFQEINLGHFLKI